MICSVITTTKLRVCVNKAILFPLFLSDDEEDLSTVTPLLVASYIFCYTPFVVSEVTTALTHYEILRATVSAGTQVENPQCEHTLLHS